MVNRKYKAFTLIELLLAIVLTTCLMAGVLAVVADLEVPAAAVADDDFQEATADIPDPLAAWVRLLREDINHSNGIADMSKNDFALSGLSSLAADDRRCTHRPVLVSYRLCDVGGRKFVFRSQRNLDVLNNENIQRDLVCCDIESFEIIAQGLDESGLLEAEVASGKKEEKQTGTEEEKKDNADEKPQKKAVGNDEVQVDSMGYKYRGLHYFPKYAPAWLKAKAAAQGLVVEDEKNVADKKKEAPRKKSRVIWRLRVVRQGESRPVERLIMIQGDASL